MVYQYTCHHCVQVFDVIKSHHESEKDELCPKCGEFAVKDFCPQKIHLMKTKVTHPEFNPGLGCVVKNERHLKDLCKEKGVEEIGNEKPETLHQHFDQAREEKIEKAYEESDRGWQGEVWNQ